jgi:hypothetical protein
MDIAPPPIFVQHYSVKLQGSHVEDTARVFEIRSDDVIAQSHTRPQCKTPYIVEAASVCLVASCAVRFMLVTLNCAK